MNTRRHSHFLSMENLPSAPQLDPLYAGLNSLLADVFVLYFKTKNFHWHVSGPHFVSYHTLFDSQASQLLGMTDVIAERVLKLGGTTLRGVGDVLKNARCKDSELPPDADASAMLTELQKSNEALCSALKELRVVCEQKEHPENVDSATAALIDVWLDETEKRIWFLAQSRKS